MSKSLLSVVMPVYNAARHLPACLDSLEKQTLAPAEIIAVDDGSTDNSLAIIDGYLSRLPNLRVIRQRNGGAAAARNAGLMATSGDYIAFLDADDVMLPEMCERLISMALQDRLDIAMVNASYHYAGHKPDELIYKGVPASEVISGRQWMKARLFDRFMPHMVWWHLYARDFIAQHQLRFPEGRTYEDVIWTTRAFLAAERVRFQPESLYLYRVEQRSISDQGLTFIIESSIKNAEDMVELADAEMDAELSALLRWQAVDGGMSVFHRLEKIADPVVCRSITGMIRAQRYHQLLWKNSTGWRYKRRIARHWLRSWLGGLGR